MCSEIFGSDQSVCDPDIQPPTCVLIWDTGSVSITVGSFTASANYSKNTTAAQLASALGGQFNSNSNSPVTATVNSATINLISKVAGTQTNYVLSVQGQSNRPDLFSSSFDGNPSGATMTAGADGTGSDGNPPTLNTPLVTVSNYDPLDDLVSVFQGVQQRLFQYDSMGRLTQSATPEAGTSSFQYNSFNLLTQRTDARGVITNYSYDTLNRLSQVSYNVGTTGVPATASVNYSYDEGGAAAFALGRLTHFSDGVGTETYTYDALGRTTNLQKVIGGMSYPIAYQYNYASELKQITYPSGRVVAQAFDPIGRLSQLQVNGSNYLSALSYNAAGEALGFTYGNGVQATLNYNSQMQLASLAYTKTGSTLFSLTYNYGTGNNGQIQSITDNVDSTRTTTFTYDPWSRLKTASNSQWSIAETYDRYGNRNAQTPPVNFSQAANPVTNRLPSPYAYDAAGNMTNDGSNTLVYDAESRSISGTNGAASGAYVYDGNSLRVKRCLSNCTSPTTTTVYLFSGSKVIAEYDNGAAVASPSREYIYSGAQLIATIAGGATSYHHPDHLSVRVSTDSSGNTVRTFGHFPFGEVWYETGTASKWKFTSYERDSESQNDYAMARFYVNRLGRFSSPDPLAGSVADPESLNRYAYVLNDPPNLADPTGAGPFCLLDENGNCHGGGGGGSCTIDGFAADCGMASALLAADAAVELPPGVTQSGFINGHFYYLTATSDEDGNYLDYNYFGLSAAQIEILGLPTEIDLTSVLGLATSANGAAKDNEKKRQEDCAKKVGTSLISSTNLSSLDSKAAITLEGGWIKISAQLGTNPSAALLGLTNSSGQNTFQDYWGVRSVGSPSLHLEPQPGTTGASILHVDAYNPRDNKQGHTQKDYLPSIGIGTHSSPCDILAMMKGK